jgi:hypothetical protein
MPAGVGEPKMVFSGYRGGASKGGRGVRRVDEEFAEHDGLPNDDTPHADESATASSRYEVGRGLIG